jgi:hypothetical protein
MAKIPAPEELLELNDGDPIEQAAAAISCIAPAPGSIYANPIDR